jgi:Lrp/AsnC family transcriptional regulator, leucine-responsive regulatory protein
MAFDSVDRRIVRELQEDGRLTNAELSRRVNLSPSPCLRRVKNLEDKGVITGYTANVDQDKFGLPISIFVSVKLEKQTEDMLRTFEAQIADIDEIAECYLMTGGFDYLLRIITDSLKSYENVLTKRITHIPGIASIESSFALGIVKQSKIYPG